jgi:glycosyltransferase involved in cell wall biosynthesis
MMTQIGPSATVVVPAHNEESGLRRLLPRLLKAAQPGEFKILVMCNGCTDGSAEEARRYGPDVEVIELSQPSKAAALAEGRARVAHFPVVFVDADVALDTSALRALVASVAQNGALAAAPERTLEKAGVSRLAGWYYDIWERLPTVRSGLFGRGVIALSEEGFRRVSGLPRFMSDDLAFSEAFEPSERRVVPEAVVSVWPARTWRSLLNRRIRVVRGTRELNAAGGLTPAASTHLGDLIGIVREEPWTVTRIPLFLATTVIARARERQRRPYEPVWARDETSRTS